MPGLGYEQSTCEHCHLSSHSVFPESHHVQRKSLHPFPNYFKRERKCRWSLILPTKQCWLRDSLWYKRAHITLVMEFPWDLGWGKETFRSLCKKFAEKSLFELLPTRDRDRRAEWDVHTALHRSPRNTNRCGSILISACHDALCNVILPCTLHVLRSFNVTPWNLLVWNTM